MSEKVEKESVRPIKKQVKLLLSEYEVLFPVSDEHLIVVGVSTSEVVGKKIGTAGAFDVAAMIYAELSQYRERTGVQLAFQCCEHLNRALVIDQHVATQRGYDIVTVLPTRDAGGSMATYAYEQMPNPVIVETIQADGGIDIGSTLIGMHLKPVAVPLRASVRQIGQAPVTIAKTRPKLIGGARAVYP